MITYKMLIAYDGAKYKGWQRLGNTDKTIQGKLEAVLSKMMERPMEITGASRTDAGVHAYGQVAHFKMEEFREEEDVRDYFNRYLPDDIVVKEVTHEQERFHSRHNVSTKTYVYRIRTGPMQDPFDRRYNYHVAESLDVNAMKKAAKRVEGRHDFTSFSNAKSKKKSMERTLHEVRFEKEGDYLKIYFTGSGFLHNMVRRLAGTFIEVGLGRMTPDEVETVLLRKERAGSGPTAPSEGLFLLEVHY